MTRVTRGYIARRRRRKNRSSVSGFRGAHSRHTRTINQQKMRALVSSHQDRGRKKRDFRRLWITRINAVIHENKNKSFKNYSYFISKLYKNQILLNRKILSKIAISNRISFDNISISMLLFLRWNEFKRRKIFMEIFPIINQIKRQEKFDKYIQLVIIFKVLQVTQIVLILQLLQLFKIRQALQTIQAVPNIQALQIIQVLLIFQIFKIFKIGQELQIIQACRIIQVLPIIQTLQTTLFKRQEEEGCQDSNH